MPSKELFEKGFNLAEYAGIPEEFKGARDGIEDINDYFALEYPAKRFIIYGEVVEDENGEIELLRVKGTVLTLRGNKGFRYGRKLLKALDFIARKTRNPEYNVSYKVEGRVAKRTVEISPGLRVLTYVLKGDLKNEKIVIGEKIEKESGKVISYVEITGDRFSKLFEKKEN
jgi:hypothetical protein